MSSRAYWWRLGMWKMAGRTWWVCSSYFMATGSRVLPFSLLCRVVGCSAPPSHTRALVWYPFVSCNAQSGCCYMRPPSSHVNTGLLWTPFSLTPSWTPWKSTLPSLPSPITWTLKLLCLLHCPYVPQIQPHPFFSLFSFVQVLRCCHKAHFCLWCCGSFCLWLSGLYVKFSLQTWSSQR